MIRANDEGSASEELENVVTSANVRNIVRLLVLHPTWSVRHDVPKIEHDDYPDHNRSCNQEGCVARRN